MIADYADKLNTYEEFKDYADMVQQFIKKQKEENLPEGRYDLSHWKVHRWNPIRNTVTFSTL